jgi:protease PrsW
VNLSASLVSFGVVQTLLYLLFIRAIDLYEREPLRYVLPVFIWGFAVATTVSLIFNTIVTVTVGSVASVQVTNFVTAVVAAPVIEETSKGMALLIIFLVAYLASRRRGLVEFAGVMDGIVYGSAVGFGFAIAEDILYYLQFGPDVFVMRRLFGGFAHAAFTSLTGIGIGLIPWVRYRVFSPLPPLLGLTGAILLHATFNFTATVFGGVAYILLFFVVLGYLVTIVVWLAIERLVIRQELLDEVAAGTITQQEYVVIPTYFRRTAYYLGLIFSGKLSTWLAARKLHAAAVDLALSKRLMRRSYSPSREGRVTALRQKILGLRQQNVLRTET